MLSLTSSDLPLVYRNHLSKLVTSLPYLDAEPEDSVKLKVERMIKQEMAMMEKKNYLEDLPMPPTAVFDEGLIHNEILRVKKHELLEEPQVHSLPSSEISSLDVGELKAYNEKANILTQHNNMRQINLELMLKFGPDAHKIFIEYQNNYKGFLAAANAKLKTQIDDINSKRKFEQSIANDKLSNFQYKIGNLIQKKEELEVACQQLEDEVLLLRKKQLKLA